MNLFPPFIIDNITACCSVTRLIVPRWQTKLIHAAHAIHCHGYGRDYPSKPSQPAQAPPAAPLIAGPGRPAAGGPDLRRDAGGPLRGEARRAAASAERTAYERTAYERTTPVTYKAWHRPLAALTRGEAGPGPRA